MTLPALFRTCPRCGHTPPDGTSNTSNQCSSCGLQYRDWVHDQLETAKQRRRSAQGRNNDNAGWLFEFLFEVPPRNDIVEIGIRAACFALLVAWGLWFIFTDYTYDAGGIPDIGASFMHRVDLVFHEAGHIIFMAFGDFMSTLGGSLMQLLVPIAVLLAFLLKHRNTFSASCALWWLAQSLMDLAPYVADAKHQRLILLGGVTGSDRPGYHDWNNILGRFDALDAGRDLGAAIDLCGELLMWTAFAWGATVLWRQWRHRSAL